MVATARSTNSGDPDSFVAAVLRPHPGPGCYTAIVKIAGQRAD